MDWHTDTVMIFVPQGRHDVLMMTFAEVGIVSFEELANECVHILLDAVESEIRGCQIGVGELPTGGFEACDLRILNSFLSGEECYARYTLGLQFPGPVWKEVQKAMKQISAENLGEFIAISIAFVEWLLNRRTPTGHPLAFFAPGRQAWLLPLYALEPLYGWNGHIEGHRLSGNN